MICFFFKILLRYFRINKYKCFHNLIFFLIFFVKTPFLRYYFFAISVGYKIVECVRYGSAYHQILIFSKNRNDLKNLLVENNNDLVCSNLVIGTIIYILCFLQHFIIFFHNFVGSNWSIKYYEN